MSKTFMKLNQKFAEAYRKLRSRLNKALMIPIVRVPPTDTFDSITISY